MMIRPDLKTTGKQVAPVLLAVLVLLAAGLGGCGYKNLPVPPQKVLPRPITDLRYKLNEKGVTLYWSYPRETVQGEKLTGIASFDLYRAVVPLDSYCGSCPVPYGRPISLPGGAVSDGGRGGPRTAVYESTLLRPRHLYFFKVRSKHDWWAKSADSNIVSFVWDIPPKAPAGLTVRAEDGKVALSWRPVTRHLDGTVIKEPVRYQVLRSRNGAFTPLGAPRHGLNFIDSQVRNGTKYRYKVQAVIVYEKGMVGGGSTKVVTAVPIDRTAPATPLAVKAVRTARGVKVFWSPVTANDLKGYRIYRRLPGEKEPALIGEVNVPYTIFEDRLPPRAARWFYSVSSIDTVSPANESARSPEVMVRN